MALAKSGIILQNIVSKKYQFEIGENLQGFEIKLDALSITTGRLSIEIAEKTNANNPDWIPSGIYRNDNSWLYVQGNWHWAWIFDKKVLIRLEKSGRYLIEEALGTIRKFYISTNLADQICSKKLKLRKWG